MIVDKRQPITEVHYADQGNHLTCIIRLENGFEGSGRVHKSYHSKITESELKAKAYEYAIDFIEMHGYEIETEVEEEDGEPEEEEEEESDPADILESLRSLRISVTERLPADPPNPETDKGGVRVTIRWSGTLEESIYTKKAWDVLDALTVTLSLDGQEITSNRLSDRYEGELESATPSQHNYGSAGDSEHSWDKDPYPLDDNDDPIKPDKVTVSIKVKGASEELKLEVTNFSFN